jgi:hypothetical protein
MLTRKSLCIVSIALVAPSLPASAQQGFETHRLPAQNDLTVNPTPRRAPASSPSTRSVHGRLPLHNFGGHTYYGKLAWNRGRWHHEKHNGRFGWWWDVGGIWYFYPEAIEGPPAYVSDIESDEEADAAPTPSPQEPRHTFYYRPGDIKGVPYDTIEECSQASEREGGVGVCVMK